MYDRDDLIKPAQEFVRSVRKGEWFFAGALAFLLVCLFICWLFCACIVAAMNAFMLPWGILVNPFTAKIGGEIVCLHRWEQGRWNINPFGLCCTLLASIGSIANEMLCHGWMRLIGVGILAAVPTFAVVCWIGAYILHAISRIRFSVPVRRFLGDVP